MGVAEILSVGGRRQQGGHGRHLSQSDELINLIQMDVKSSQLLASRREYPKYVKDVQPCSPVGLTQQLTDW